MEKESFSQEASTMLVVFDIWYSLAQNQYQTTWNLLQIYSIALTYLEAYHQNSSRGICVEQNLWLFAIDIDIAKS